MDEHLLSNCSVCGVNQFTLVQCWPSKVASWWYHHQWALCQLLLNSILTWLKQLSEDSTLLAAPGKLTCLCWVIAESFVNIQELCQWVFVQVAEMLVHLYLVLVETLHMSSLLSRGSKSYVWSLKTTSQLALRYIR